TAETIDFLQAVAASPSGHVRGGRRRITAFPCDEILTTSRGAGRRRTGSSTAPEIAQRSSAQAVVPTGDNGLVWSSVFAAPSAGGLLVCHTLPCDVDHELY